MDPTLTPPALSNILCLDPSLTGFGWAVVVDGELKDFGIIRSKPIKTGTVFDSDLKRVTLIVKTLNQICSKYDINQIISEASTGSKSSSAAKALNLCKGLVISMAITMGVDLKLVMARTVKKKITGNLDADKSEIIDFISKKYNNPFTKLPQYAKEAICDALATLEV